MAQRSVRTSFSKTAVSIPQILENKGKLPFLHSVSTLVQDIAVRNYDTQRWFLTVQQDENLQRSQPNFSRQTHSYSGSDLWQLTNASQRYPRRKSSSDSSRECYQKLAIIGHLLEHLKGISRRLRTSISRGLPFFQEASIWNLCSVFELCGKIYGHCREYITMEWHKRADDTSWLKKFKKPDPLREFNRLVAPQSSQYSLTQSRQRTKSCRKCWNQLRYLGVFSFSGICSNSRCSIRLSAFSPKDMDLSASWLHHLFL